MSKFFETSIHATCFEDDDEKLYAEQQQPIEGRAAGLR
jgi:hypothetical protein